jgi:uncharacterized protein YaaQ
MQLLIAFVQDEDADLLCKQLNSQDIRVTRINTVGGFLARGNVTILVGVEDERVDRVVEVIRATCKTRRSFINPMPWGAEPANLALTAPAMPLEVLVGGATVFSLPVKRFVRLRGGAEPPATDEKELSVGRPRTILSRFAESAEGANPMDLVLAVVQNEDADAVIRALIAAGHRVTRINTAGGFLRRGNVTLLVGVEPQKVDDVLGVIQANCRLRTEPSPTSAGIPMYGATVFVLETALTLHL